MTGRIYAQDCEPEKPLFNFKRVATRSGGTLEVIREYSYPDGKPAAREHVLYNGNALVSFDLEEIQLGAKGGAKIRREPQHSETGRIEFEYTKTPEPNARPKPRSEVLAPDTLIADMMGPFLGENWDRLARGEKVKCRYIVVPRRETVGFTFSKESESTWRSSEVIILRMEPSSRLLATLVKPLFFTLEKQPPHRVLQYVGRTTLKIQAGDKWKDLDAVTIFDWQ